MAKIGYARVSSVDQDFNGQIERLRAAGCDRVFSEKASGKSTNGRHALDKAIKTLRPGDTLVTVRLDRLARSIRDLLNRRLHVPFGFRMPGRWSYSLTRPLRRALCRLAFLSG
jgi:DNA invertase Pin-like site-specific DNA recombinase